jgi:hypothetical protein
VSDKVPPNGPCHPYPECLASHPPELYTSQRRMYTSIVVFRMFIKYVTYRYQVTCCPFAMLFALCYVQMNPYNMHNKQAAILVKMSVDRVKSVMYL